jgi:hypothetical protein
MAITPRETLSLLIILHPTIVTLLVVALAAWALIGSRLRQFRRPILLGTAAALTLYFIVDSAFAHRRAAYARQISQTAVIHRTIQPPASLVLVDLPCDEACLDRLAAGTFENVIATRDRFTTADAPMRYTLRRGPRDDCPADSQRQAERIWYPASVQALRDKGLCPLIEGAEVPSQGIFVVHEGVEVTASKRAITFSPRSVHARPPGAVISFSAIEVQRRTSAETEVLAEALYYEAPGYLGLPPLIGCWERPDAIIWILPAGDTGCGFWRGFVGGGNRQDASHATWVYSSVFTGRP